MTTITADAPVAMASTGLVNGRFIAVSRSNVRRLQR